MALGISLKGTRRATLMVFGVVVGTVVIGMALATILTQITGSVSANEFIPTTTTSTTTTTTIPSGDGLEAAISSSPGGCTSALNAGSMDLGAIAFDLNTGLATPSFQFLCVRNVGPGDMTTLTLQMITTISGEDACSESEESVDPEGVGCGTDGELDDILQFNLSLVGGDTFGPGSFNCKSPLSVAPGGPQSLLFSSNFLGQGGQCVWQTQLQFTGAATHDQKLAASTDSVAFTFDVTGSGSGTP